jgi:ActR/RegA family two-component response regulator
MDKLDIANTKILLVEDNPKYLAQLEKWFERFGYQHLDTARNPEEATEKLDQSLFEIIVADMRLGTDDGGGFVVFEEIKKRNLSAAVIILTANETVADCRRAHRMDGWDYISKNMKGNVFEAVHDSIQAAMAYFNRWGNRKDEKWIEENADYLEENYTNQYVAVINHGVIESADTEEALKQQLDELKLPRFLPVIKKIEAKAPPSITELIQKGESATVEFKRIFQYDGTEKRSEDLRLKTLKTIVAFLNSDGGTLLIGVEDDGDIYGLENDFSLLGQKRAAIDLFEQELTSLIWDRIGKPFAQHITINFEEMDGKQICAIVVKKANQEAFYKAIFYCRVNCTTQAIKTLEEFANYQREKATQT